MKPVPHCKELSIQKPPEDVILDETISDSHESKEKKTNRFWWYNF